MKAIACNLYKLTLTGGVTITLTANSGQSSTHIGPTALIEKSPDGGVVKGAVSILPDSRIRDGDGGTNEK